VRRDQYVQIHDITTPELLHWTFPAHGDWLLCAYGLLLVHFGLYLQYYALAGPAIPRLD